MSITLEQLSAKMRQGEQVPLQQTDSFSIKQGKKIREYDR